MGRVKEMVAAEQPTIGDSRRHGITQFEVRCPPPCRHIATVKFDATGLPDSTIFHDIPKKCRLRCTVCQRVAKAIEMSWVEHVAVGNGKRPIHGWVVVARAPEGVEMRSSSVASREQAMGLAHDLADQGDEVLRIEGPMGDVTAGEIAADRAR